MSKPLIGNPKRVAEASQFHKDVFALFGGPKKLCVFCHKPGATDAAHIIPRARLGPLRYASPRFARPAHRACHEAQERHEVDFTLSDRLDAIMEHNALSKVSLPIPEI